MKVTEHLDKIRKLKALRERLDPEQDFELWFWAGMTAGTHAVNAALHDAGITVAEEAFPTQPGVYLIPQADGSLLSAFRPLGDVLHVGRPKIEAPVPEDVAAMMRQMEIIEHHRDPCLLYGKPVTPTIIQECDAALGHCLELLSTRGMGA